MNYYPHHIGDYLRDTAHLSLLEHGAYRRMLDLYYASEKALPLDITWLCRLVRAELDVEREAVQFVLQHFFEKFEDGWHNKRADDEIKVASKKAKAARANGKKGGRPRTHRVTAGLANRTQEEPKSKLPITNNQEPRTKELQLAQSAEALSLASPVNGNAVCYIPINDGTEFGISQAVADELARLYPNVDVPQTLNEIRGYNLARPTRRKTRRGVLAHINTWMAKEQNRGAKA